MEGSGQVSKRPRSGHGWGAYWLPYLAFMLVLSVGDKLPEAMRAHVLLLQVAAQNQMLRLHFNRLGVIGGMELPDLDLDDSTRRILEDIEEEPFVSADGSEDSGLVGFDDCLHGGVCR